MKLEIMDAIWNKMLVTYGSEWTRKFDGMPMDEVKGAWADDLRGYTIEQIKYGLSMLGERPPNLIQFKDLCKKAPQYFDSPQLTYRPTPSEEKLAKFRRAYEEN